MDVEAKWPDTGLDVVLTDFIFRYDDIRRALRGRYCRVFFCHAQFLWGGVQWTFGTARRDVPAELRSGGINKLWRMPEFIMKGREPFRLNVTNGKFIFSISGSPLSSRVIEPMFSRYMPFLFLEPERSVSGSFPVVSAHTGRYQRRVSTPPGKVFARGDRVRRGAAHWRLCDQRSTVQGWKPGIKAVACAAG